MPSSQRVYVGNIGSDIRERDLEKFFKGFGKIGDIAVKNGYGFVDFDDHRDADDAVHDLDGKDFRGSRIRVELARDRRDRDRDGGDRRGGGRDGGRGGGRYDDRGGGRRDDRRGGFNDRRGGGGGARGGNPPGRKTEFRCVVENISAATSWQDLKDYFKAAGDVRYTNAHKLIPGQGIVEFGDKRGLEYAMKNLDDTELDGKRIKLVPQGGGFGDRDRGGDRERRGSGGGSGSRRRSASRSRSRSRSKSRSRSPAERKSRSRSRSKSERDSRSRSKS